MRFCALIFAFGVIFQTPAFAAYSPEALAAKLSTATCAKIPNGKYVLSPINPLDPKSSKFMLFYFSAKPFNPSLPSILALGGGPGGISAASNSNLAGTFPDHNLIEIHVRGAGCGTFPVSDKFNKFITTEFVVHDIEQLRRALKIKKWAAIVGISYDTNTARMYASRYPENVGAIVLDSVDGGDLEPMAYLPIFYRVLNKITDRAQEKLGHVLSESQIQNTRRQIEEDYLQLMLYPEHLWNWLYDKSLGKKMELQRSHEYVLLMSLLLFEGEVDELSSDIYLVLLFAEFHPFLKANLEKDHFATIETADRQFFPYRYRDYQDLSKSTEFMSWRVNQAMSENEDGTLKGKMCSSVPTLALQGAMDISTPLVLTVKDLGQPGCMSGPMTLAVFETKGHSLLSEECALSLTRAWLSGNGTQVQNIPAECKDEQMHLSDPRSTM